MAQLKELLVTGPARFLTKIKANVEGNLTGNADTATKATKDANDNVITTTYATKAALNEHVNKKDNPHGVTKTQVGLGNVDNTADKDKNVATAVKATQDANGNVITTTYATKAELEQEASARSEEDAKKQATITGAATTITDDNLIASRALVSNGSGKVAISDVTSTELGYLDGVTSAIQTQLDNKLSLAGGNITGHIYLTGAKEASSTGNTSQLIFGTSSNNHVTVSSNTNALVINPELDKTTNQIVLYLDKHSLFPSGIAKDNSGNAPAIGTKNIGASNTPVYINAGKITPISYEVNASVPSDAKFTDTTYSNATTSAAGLMSTTDKAKLNNTNVAYGICDTAAATAEKAVTLYGNTNWVLITGAIIMVKFTNSNTASSVKLNVNGTGAYPIWYSTAEYINSDTAYTGYANRTITYMFNGTHWVWISSGYDANTIFTGKNYPSNSSTKYPILLSDITNGTTYSSNTGGMTFYRDSDVTIQPSTGTLSALKVSASEIAANTKIIAGHIETGTLSTVSNGYIAGNLSVGMDATVTGTVTANDFIGALNGYAIKYENGYWYLGYDDEIINIGGV